MKVSIILILAISSNRPLFTVTLSVNLEHRSSWLPTLRPLRRHHCDLYQFSTPWKVGWVSVRARFFRAPADMDPTI
ncbi:hypothetical protein C8J56DRAFT_925246 [Mycena floridula]|nr:hypothetical protein C8J56DRAFT_925246 [Mycena floridula]